MKALALFTATLVFGCAAGSDVVTPEPVEAADIVVHGTAGRRPQPFELRLSPSKIHPGDIFVLTLEVRANVAGGEVELDGRTFPVVSEDGVYTAIVGLDLDAKPGPARLSFRLGEFIGTRDIQVSPKKFGSESLKVKPSYTDLSKKTLARVETESAKMKKLWATVTPEKLWDQPFLKPTNGALGSPFGLRRIFNGKPRNPHSGLDIKSPTGTPIKASNRGRAVLAGNLFFTGNTVVIDHGLGLYTLYAHLSRIDSKPGAMIERGEVVGLVGATGRVTGAHLHWGAKLVGTRVDPVTLPGLLL